MFLEIRSEVQIVTGTYFLNNFSPGLGHYSYGGNGIQNIFRTDVNQTGTLIIDDLLIEGKRIIRGRFSFQAADSLNQNNVVVSNGFFQVLLKDY